MVYTGLQGVYSLYAVGKFEFQWGSVLFHFLIWDHLRPLKVAINLSWQWCGVEQSRNIWLRHNYHKSPGGILVHFTSVVCVQDKWQGLSFNWILIPLSAVGILKVCNKRKVSSSLLWHVSSIFIFPSPPLNFKLVDVYLLKENKFWGKSFWNVQLHVFFGQLSSYDRTVQSEMKMS